MRKPAETGDGGTLEHPSVTRRWCFPDCSIFSLACYLQMPIAETIWVSETQQCHRKVCIFKGTEWWLQLIVIVWASLNFSQFLECKTEDHMKVQKLLCSFLSQSDFQLYTTRKFSNLCILKKYTYIYKYIYILHFVFGSCSTRCFRISAISIRCFLHGRLVQREFSRAFWYKQSVP